MPVPTESDDSSLMTDAQHFPASAEQERAFVLDRKASDTVAPHTYRAWVVSGPLSTDVVRRALEQLTSRHEILRTDLSDESGRLTQVVRARVEPDLTVADLLAAGPAGAEAADEAAHGLVEDFVSRRFDLSAAPLWRMLLVRLAETRHLAVLCMHPAVADATTPAAAFGELLALYAEAADPAALGEAADPAGAAEPGPTTPVQYRDYARRQRTIEPQVMRRDEHYWSEVLSGGPQPSGLPMFGTRPATLDYRCRGLRRVLPAEVAVRVDEIASRTGGEPGRVLAAACAALLYRYGARDGVTFGHQLSGRRPDPARPALGPYRSPVMLRLPIDVGTTFEEALRCTAARLHQAEQHADHPFEWIVRAEPSRDAGGLAPFRLVFDGDLGTVIASRPGLLRVQDYPLPPVSVGYDVQVTARRLTDGVALDWSYAADLYTAEQIAQVADHVVQLLSAASRSPQLPIATLPYLDAADLALIEQRWNTARTPYPRHAVHRLIEEQVARTPQAIALEFGGRRLRYDELDQQAARLARHLTAFGARPGQTVGLCLDRSIDLVVAVVAILKSGCAVVPLDPAYPADRLRFMVDDAGLRIVVTARSLVDRTPALGGLFTGLTQIRTDADAAMIDSRTAERPSGDPSPDAIAYCIYTSGSTGRPKGVVVEHAALANLVSWHRSAWLSDVGTRTLLYSPISFDVSFHEILAGLCTGATLIQVDEATRRNPMALLEFAHEQRVAKWYMPFVTLQQMAQAAQTAPVPADLREIIVGGEVLRITPEIRDFARRTGCVIHNHYGSTECIDVATHTLSGDPARWPSVVPIGRANVHNMNLYILDDAGQPVPEGVVGELYAEGDCLAAHYHGRPELTAERFLPSPFGIQGPRLYRMGDLGRYLPDGTVECLGRADNQVKIRGYRVEPSEVEAVLAEHATVAECVVVAKATGRGQNQLVAYVVPATGVDGRDLPDRLRADLTLRLPDYMTPTAYVLLDALPLTPSGKADVRALPDARATPPTAAGQSDPADPPAGSDWTVIISRIWADLLDLAEVPAHRSFFELGGDSIALVRAHQLITEIADHHIPVDALFRHPTVAQLSRFLGSTARPGGAESEPGQPAEPTQGRDVAIIGMACRVPGAADLDQFWQNLREGVESITVLPSAAIHRLERDQTADPHFVPVAAMVTGADQFDAAFFGYSAAEAAVIDPQQRLFLECAWEAVENAGFDPARNQVGVWAGASLNTYLINNVLPAKLPGRTFLSHRHFDEATELRIEQGNAGDHLPMRVSFKLDLRGPSVNVQSTCSTSLVAVHQAVQALVSDDCDVALAGGVSVVTPQNTGYLWRDGMMVATDGHCRAFDVQADGTVFGNGLGVVVLKRLSAAVADGDHIYAVIKGSAVNNDGAAKMDYSGPSVVAQADVIARAHERAGVTADSISYIEAHGTGTRLGDPIEIAGLVEAFGRSTRHAGATCAIGSVKTNIGHLDEAAGVVGLIKTALSLHHGELPPSLHFRTPNPMSALAQSPFHVNAELRDWPAEPGKPRRAGVSSFGMGGTNCHVVLEEAPTPRDHPPTSPDRGAYLLPISARTTAALRGNLERYRDRIEHQDERAFADFCYSAATGRRHFEARIAIQAADAAGALAQLTALLNGRDLGDVVSRADQTGPPLAFVVSGQGTQYPGMARSLYDTQPVFRAALNECDELLRPLIGRSLTGILYGAEPDPTIDDTAIAQPALFSIGYALSRLWRSWGVEPGVLLGHSIGEYVAACVAGVFSLHDALRLVAARGRLMQELPRDGAMAQVGIGAQALGGYLRDVDGAVAIAAVNAPGLTVISGRRDVLDAVCRALQRDGVPVSALTVSHAFHSPLMNPVLAPFRAIADTVRYSPPVIDIISTVTGVPIPGTEIASAGYWVRHIVDPVEFDRAVAVAEQRGVRLFLELGPKPVLTGLARQRPGVDQVRWLPSVTPHDPHAAITAYRELYLAGVPVDWTGFDAPFGRRRIPLPTYAFQRRRHWLEPPTGAGPLNPSPPPPPAPQADSTDEDSAVRTQTLIVSWEPAVSGGTAPGSPSCRVVVVGAEDGLAPRLADTLRARGGVAVDPVLGGSTESSDERLTRLFSRYEQSSARVHVVFVPDAAEPADATMRRLTGVRTILRRMVGRPSAHRLWLVAPGGQPDPVAGDGPLPAGLAALARTVNAEHPDLHCVALSVPHGYGPGDLALAAGLIEGGIPDGEEQLAIRDGRVLVPRLRPRPGGDEVTSELPIRRDGTYLITGGTGGLGLHLAVAVAAARPVRVILVSRSGEPHHDDRAAWAALRAIGPAVRVVAADVADETRMRQVVAECGADLRGVFHCAGVLEDGILLRQSDDAFAAVVRPKVEGARVLHQVTRHLRLDFFVLFSSLASLLGYRGQGVYAVANESLDELARWRRQQGLPALSVSWGSWAEAGMTDRLPDRYRAQLLAEGEHLLSWRDGVRALATLMAGDTPHAAVTRMDWARFAATRPRIPSMITSLIGDPTGKTHDAGRAPFAERLRAAPPPRARQILRDTVTTEVRRLLGDEVGPLDPTRGFEELGVDSLGALDLRSRLQTVLGRSLPATLAFELPCLDDLVRHLEEKHFDADIRAVPTPYPETGSGRSATEPPPATAPEPEPAGSDAVAIIGMSCRLPGANTPEAFWRLVVEGRDAIGEIPPDRWDLERWYDASPEAEGKMYVRRAALIDDLDAFDPAFFGISPREAATMDPRHRLLLESAWSAVESAGIDPSTLRGTNTGVYLGCDEFLNDYLRQAETQLGVEPHLATGTTLSFSAGRVSYKLGLHGPSMVIATACSSSLVALHAATRAVRQAECAMAIVAGAKLMLAPEETAQLCRLAALAPDGVSKAFAADADGFGRGEGAATLLLKRLDQAVADGDPVLAVIRGSAVNHDGSSAGLTVPNGAAQSRLIAKALTDAGVAPADVTYLETHGTGTQLGDPIEVRALAEAFGGRSTPLLIGSVKANIGHLEEAAGLAGVIKTVLALQHGVIPPQIHCAELNRNVDWADLPLAVPRIATGWPAGAARIAGVSSFGMSGTNAHVVLQAYAPSAAAAAPTEASADRANVLFPFSGRDKADLDAVLRQFVEFLSTPRDPAEVAYTLQTGRRSHPYRCAVLASDTTALRDRLQTVLSGAPDAHDVLRGRAETAGPGTRPAQPPVVAADLAGTARAWCDGYAVDWPSLHAGPRPRRVALPTYPFKRNRLWVGEERTAHVQPQQAPHTTEPAESPVRNELLASLRTHLAELLGMRPADLSATARVDELGADSLTFMRISQFLRDRYQVVISFQQLIEEAATIESLVGVVSERLPSPASAVSSPALVAGVSSPAAVLGVPARLQAPARPELRSGPLGRRSGPPETEPPDNGPLTTEQLTDPQSRFLTELVAAYSARTRRSKEEAENDRAVLANCRMLPWQALCKEMSYPIVVDRSCGARFVDMDGNEYLDISMGYGVHLFGHQPDFVVQALRAQLDRGLHIGPQADQAGHVARLLCELTGMARAVFCNSGTEAVMAALRFARAATKRTRFVMFEGSYHGWSDNTLALPAGDQGAIPMARGIGAGVMNDVVVLEYGTRESLEKIRELGPQLAAVLVEPVQSRRPDLQPIDFLRELREITRVSGSALVFDEVITGFRVHPGGAQVWSGVEADIVTYGKVLGGGMPIGAVAGRAEFMDTVDGGAWRYGDGSSPSVPTTFFGGTFNKNPLTMAAAHAVLTHVRATGPTVQQRLADSVSGLAEDFNAFCRDEGFPLRIVHFSSMFRFIGEGEYSLQRFPLAIDLFFHLLTLRGIYVLETRVCFLSSSHTPDDLQFILQTAQSCLRTLRGAGFFATADGTRGAATTGTVRSSRLAGEARLDLAFAPHCSTPAAEARDVLLTGATGFLGAYLTADLLRHTGATVHCLVRARDARHARDRVLDNLAAYGRLTGVSADRLVGIPADLAAARLGLSDDVWNRLAATMDAIYHNGAQVNSLLSYEKLRAVNVDGTRELLRLATQGRPKTFHHISSDAVFDAYGYHRQAKIYEDEPLAHGDSLYGGGYAETKWVADKLVANARAAGLTAAIYRPGMLTGASTDGCGQLNDFFARFLKGIIQLGICPELDGTIDVAPVDVVSRTVVEISVSGGGGTYHLTHPEPISYRGFIDAVVDAGYPVEVVPLHVWDAALAKLRYEDDNALYPLLPLFTESVDPVFRRSRLDVRNTAAAVGGSVPVSPDLLTLIATYLERFSAAGFLPEPLAARPTR
ncbi:amino acid adenylation domain-containing protein [Micromonospora rubida]|uniref:Amino acid adenylation domain-containing protein n=1 Tax=Micromonospora rubida TaxID=2697657 RepID=A0ABW7SWL3_9ACTN